MDHERFIQLAWREPLGVLDPLEERLLTAHLESGCTRCARAVRAAQETLAQELSPPPVDPPPRLRERLLQSLWRARDRD